MEHAPKPDTLSELLGDWRAAGRDAKAAGAAAEVAGQALEAARAAEESARTASEAVEASLAAAQAASRAAQETAAAAKIFLVTAEGDDTRAKEEVLRADRQEAQSAQRFRDAQAEAFDRQKQKETE
jgi:hypothetical protein